jgi:transcriptional regulator with XRE-family HTH domain
MDHAMSTTLERTAAHFQRLRQRAGLSVRELQERSGVDRGVISRLESAQRLPTAATLVRLAEALEADASELLSVAGHAPDRASALPALKPYLRAKYSHLPAAARNELADYLAKLEAEHRQRSNKKN